MDFEPLPSTPEEFTRFMQAESKRWAEAVKISRSRAAAMKRNIGRIR